MRALRAEETEMAGQLGRRLQVIRLQLNLTQRELAAELGLSKRSLQEYEAGRHLPQAKRRRQIYAFLSANEKEVA